jgi:signal transduction histidine kinase
VTEPQWRPWVPDAAVGVVVALLGLLEVGSADRLGTEPGGPLVLVVLSTAVAVGLSRRLPGAALALVWVACTLQVLSGTNLLLVQASVAATAFGAARWGSTATVWLSAASIPVAALIAVFHVGLRRLNGLVETAGVQEVVRSAYQYGDRWQLAAALLGMSTLGVPWLLGLSLRFVARAQASRVSQSVAEDEAARAVRASEQAREIARLREDQTRLARDVHDVVGHSLAVILAQAESAQYLDDSDARGMKQTMATIATSARDSLRDVRQVLATTDDQAPAPDADLDALVAGVRGAGHRVESSEFGHPQPLAPEVALVAFRVLQEMLTNALRHGRRDVPVLVERHWDGDLRIEVRNRVAADAVGTAGGGTGLDGMRLRLEPVGGRLDVRRREDDHGSTFTATAWLPVAGGVR